MRSWRDKKLPALSGTELSQIVVPKPLKTKILKLTYDIPAAAHLGIIKTKIKTSIGLLCRKISRFMSALAIFVIEWKKVANLLQLLCTISQS